MSRKGSGVLVALVKQRTSFPITAGQEQGIAPELVDPPVLVRAHNCQYNRQGELSKRPGWITVDEMVEGASYLPQPEKLATRGDEILWIGNVFSAYAVDDVPLRAFSRAPAEFTENVWPVVWERKGTVPRFTAERFAEISHNSVGNKIEAWDCAVAGDDQSPVFAKGVLCAVWRTTVYSGAKANGRIDYAVIDVATGSTLAQATITGSAYFNSQVRVVAQKHSDNGWYFHIFYMRDASYDIGDLYVTTIAARLPWSWSTPAVVESTIEGFDVCASDPFFASQPRIFVVATKNASTNYYARSSRCDASGVLTSTSWYGHAVSAVVNGQPMPYTIQCACDPSGMHLAAHLVVMAPGCAGVPYNVAFQWEAATAPSFGLTWYDDVIVSGVSAGDGDGGCQICWGGTTQVSGVDRTDNWWVSWEAEATYSYRWGLLAATTGSVLSAPATVSLQLAFMPWGRPVHYEGRAIGAVARGVSTDACCVGLVGLWFTGSGDPAAMYSDEGRCLSGEIAFAGTGAAYNYPLCRGRNSIVRSGYERGRFFSAFPVVSTDGIEHKLAIMSFDAADSQRHEWAEFAGGTYFAGSIPWCYDGRNCHELGFPHRPQSASGEIIAQGKAATGTTTTAGSYYVAMCWESVDALGRVARSAPSFSGEVILTTGQTIWVTYLEIGVSTHETIRPVVYVSNDGGQNYIRSKQGLTYYISPTASIEVELVPEHLFQVGMPTLYTDSEVLENAVVTPSKHVAAWGMRLWLAQGRDVWFSRELLDGEEPAFNESLSVRMQSDCTGLVGLDDRLVLFCKNAIYWIAGDGPTDTGEGGTFGNPQRVPTDYGCVDARSVVRTEKGVFFQSARGIELLDRSLMPQVVSSGVDKWMREWGYSEIVAAAWDPEMQICRFAAKNPSDGSYVILCLHTLYGAWTTAGIPSVGDEDRTYIPVGLVRAFNRNWIALGDDAGYNYDIFGPRCRLAMESHGPTGVSYLDGPVGSTGATLNRWPQMTIETANIKLDGLLGFMRVWRADVLVKNMSYETGISVGYYTDYSSTVASASRSWTSAADIAAGATASPTHYRYQVHLDKQKCSAVRLVIKDEQLADGSGIVYPTFMTFVGFGFEWGQRPGTGRGQSGGKK